MSDPQPITVLIADDDAAFRTALVALVEEDPGLRLVAAVGDADAALAAAIAERPDVALLDVRMPGGGGPAVARGLREAGLPTRAVALSAYEERGWVVEMVGAGALGYLVKGTDVNELLEAIRRAARDQASLSARVIGEIVREIVERRESELTRRRGQERIEALLDSAPDAVVIVDADGRIQLVNAQTEKLFGYDRDELLGARVEQLLPERVVDRHVGHRGRYLAEPGTRPMGVGLPLAGRRRNGTEFPVDISLSAIDTDEGRLVTAFIRDITAVRERADLEQRVVEGRALLSRLTAASETERMRIAADIHDDSIQVIAAAGMRLQMLRRQLEDPDQVELVRTCEQTIGEAIVRLRHLIFELRPPTLDRDGLAAALRMHLEQNGREVAARFRLEDRLTTRPGPATALTLFRIAQEAIANVRKHANAEEVVVTLTERADGYAVRVADDGDGFDVEQGARPGHLGLVSMRERAELAGGRFRVDSEAGRGTEIEVFIPALGDDDLALSGESTAGPAGGGNGVTSAFDAFGGSGRR